ncbi:MAG: creatininase family protein [Planctomycetes bacterium]|nr:creatininase family protein [Planctomycetota bacterium]
MTDLAQCTWPEAQALFGPRTIALLPIGSTEPHGPHLPLDTDVTIAVAMARRAEQKLEALSVPTLVLPALAYGLTNYTSGFAGRITLRSGTLWMVLEDIVTSLEQQGLTRIVFANAHLEPEHVQVLRGVVLDHAVRSADKAQVLFPDNTRRRFADTLGAEFKSGDCHAGRYETSLVLAADPGSVRENERAQLPPLEINLIEKMKAGMNSFQQMGAEQAYCGDPAAASASEGRELVESLSEMLMISMREAWPDVFAPA